MVFITRTGSFLPNLPVYNTEIKHYIGAVWSDFIFREKILLANGIKSRHYAIDRLGNSTHTTWDMANQAIKNCLIKDGIKTKKHIGLLAVGTTAYEMPCPGLASIIHHHCPLLKTEMEINSAAGICSSSSQALSNAYRAIKCGDHKNAIVVGVEKPSDAFHNNSYTTEYDLYKMITNFSQSNFFKGSFLRYMLSDGAGVFLLEKSPTECPNKIYYQIEWIDSVSYANKMPLCMYGNWNRKLQQDVVLLNDNICQLGIDSVETSFQKYGYDWKDFNHLLVHISSFYFMKKLIKEFKNRNLNNNIDKIWTNLETRGNTGAASIFIMLDDANRNQIIKPNQRILLHIPESGQFNFVNICLKALLFPKAIYK